MHGLVEECFSNIFATIGFDDILSDILPTVTEDMNAGLNQDYIVDEVVKALYQMAPFTSIALNPNGMSPIFYKSFWRIVGGYGCFGNFEYNFYS